MRLLGLGTICLTGNLSPAQLYNVALGAGFDPDLAVTMAAIAMRESGGCPTAHNPGPGEDSYGLWQINIRGNPGILDALGLSSPTDLYDPAVNASAAYYLYGGNPANLDIAWYINRPGYMEAYQQYIPVVQAAVFGDTQQPQTYSSPPVYSASMGGGLSGGTLAAVALGGLALLLILNR